LEGDNRLNRDEDGMTVAGAVMGVPGVSGVAETVMDVGMELYGSRKATYERPQDDSPLSFREIRAIQDLNNRDIHEFSKLSTELDMIDVYLASGYKNAAMLQGSLQPIEDTSPAFKYKPDSADTEFANFNYAPSPQQKPRWAR
jgi:hypothetical protein